MMTAREREELAKLTRRREAVAKTTAKQRSAELLADVEQSLAAQFKADAAVWREITSAAAEAVAEADAKIAALCKDGGVPESFRPGLNLQWHSRGENASKERRNELRKVASTRIEALQQAAFAEIERRSVEIQTAILAGGLESEDAKAFLESMPQPAQLMPSIDVRELESSVPINMKSIDRYASWAGLSDD